MTDTYCQTLAKRGAEALRHWDTLDGDPGCHRDRAAFELMLADLRHLCDRKGWDFHKIERQSYELYLHDREGQPAIVQDKSRICGEPCDPEFQPESAAPKIIVGVEGGGS